jgi:hypothetical protein
MTSLISQDDWEDLLIDKEENKEENKEAHQTAKTLAGMTHEPNSIKISRYRITANLTHNQIEFDEFNGRCSRLVDALKGMQFFIRNKAFDIEYIEKALTEMNKEFLSILTDYRASNAEEYAYHNGKYSYTESVFKGRFNRCFKGFISATLGEVVGLSSGLQAARDIGHNLLDFNRWIPGAERDYCDHRNEHTAV